jgi:hypothetical protein
LLFSFHQKHPHQPSGQLPPQAGEATAGIVSGPCRISRMD